MAGEREDVRILYDEMLKNLAHWSRILGIYSEFITGKNDSQLLEHARRNGLILVTRDKPLFDRCRKKGVRCVLVEDEPAEDQMAQVLRETKAEVTFPARTRCASCNGELESVPKSALEGKVPEKTFSVQERFWRCASCGKIFWEGSHWRNMRAAYERLLLLQKEEKPLD